MRDTRHVQVPMIVKGRGVYVDRGLQLLIYNLNKPLGLSTAFSCQGTIKRKQPTAYVAFSGPSALDFCIHTLHHRLWHYPSLHGDISFDRGTYFDLHIIRWYPEDYTETFVSMKAAVALLPKT